MDNCIVENKEGRSMRMYKEVEIAITEVLAEAAESDSFKRRFSKLIPSFFETSYSTHDLEETIELIRMEEQHEDKV